MAAEPRRRKRNMLKLFYGGDAAPEKPSGDPMDIDCSAFQSETYLAAIYNRLPLPELVSKERSLDQQIKTLDSDMQTLVYENYNKFISATDTIRKMKSKVDDMEGEMTKLSSNMDTINSLNGSITGALSSKRAKIRKLTESHLLLKKLQFLFELPARLHKCVELKAYGEAVKYYSRAANVLEQYKELDSFKGIYDDCKNIMAKVTEIVNALIDEEGAGKDQIISNARLLLLLGKDPAELADRVFAFAEKGFASDREAQAAAFDAAKVAEAETVKLAEEEAAAKAANAPVEAEAAAAATDATAAEAEDKGAITTGDEVPAADGSEMVKVAAAVAKEGAAVDNGVKLDGGDALDEATETDADRVELFGGPSSKNAKDELLGGPSTSDDKETTKASEEKVDPLVAHPLLVFLDHGKSTVLNNLLFWVLPYLDAFVDPGKPRKCQDSGAMIEAPIRAREIGKIGSNKLAAFLGKLVGEGYLNDCVKLFVDEMKRCSKAPTTLFVTGIERLADGLFELDDMVPGANLASDGMDATVSTVKKLCRLKGQQLQDGFDAQVQAIADRIDGTPATEIQTVVIELSSWVQKEFFDTLQSLQPLVKEDLIARNRFFGQEFQDRSIRRGIVYGFISVMISNSAKFADLRGGCSDSMPIVMAGLCQRLKAGLVKKLVVFAIKLFPGKDRTVVGDANPDDLDDANEMQIAQRCHEASAAADDLLQAFVMSKAQAISNCICDQLSGSDWMAAPEPTKVSPYVIDAVKMFEETREMARVVFGAKEDKISKLLTYQQHIANRSRGNMGTSPTGDLFDKIFSERVEVYSKVEFKTHSVALSLIKIVLKAVLETARLQAFSKLGMQQVEVDVHYLGTQLWQYIEDDETEGVVSTMLTQVNQSVASRCVDPESIKASVISLIVDQLDEE